MAGSNVCRMHGGAAPQVRKAAQARLDMASDVAVVQILNIMADKATPVAVKLAAAKEVLDRAGISAAKRIDVELSARPMWEDVAEAILVDVLPDGQEDIEDAVIVTGYEDEPAPSGEVEQDGVGARSRQRRKYQRTDDELDEAVEKRERLRKARQNRGQSGAATPAEQRAQAEETNRISAAREKVILDRTDPGRHKRTRTVTVRRD